jgi:lipopolysaccharide export system permease protein
MREFGHTAATVGTVLVSILLVTQVARLLGQAAGGALAPDAVLAMLGFGALYYFPIILSLTLFVAVLLTLNRCYRDSEMIVWFSAGVSLTRFIVPVLKFSAPFAVVVAILSLFIAPWAEQRSNEFESKLESRDEVSQITPGVFVESKHADRVFFVDALSMEKGVISNVFVQSLQDHKLGIMVAERAHQANGDNGDRFIVLVKGRRYEGTPGTPEYKLADFETYAMRIEPREANRREPSAKALTLTQIVADPTPINIAELHWRIGLPISLLVLAVLAIPLSYANPRAGRSAHLVMALLIYMIYNNLLSIAQAWVVQGKLAPAVGLWPVHALLAAILVLFYSKRLLVLSPRRLWKRLQGETR